MKKAFLFTFGLLISFPNCNNPSNSNRPVIPDNLVYKIQNVSAFIPKDTLIAPNDSAPNFCDTCYRIYIDPEKPLMIIPYFSDISEDTILFECRMKQHLNDTFYINIYDSNRKLLFNIFKLYSPLTYNFSVSWDWKNYHGINQSTIYRIQAKQQNYCIEYWIKL
jgi:hypothetical protein